MASRQRADERDRHLLAHPPGAQRGRLSVSSADARGTSGRRSRARSARPSWPPVVAEQMLYVDLEAAPEMDRATAGRTAPDQQAPRRRRGRPRRGHRRQRNRLHHGQRGRPPPHPGPAQRPATGRGLGTDQQDRRQARSQARLRLPSALRLSDRLPHQRRHRHPRQRDAASAGPEADRRNRKGLPRRQGHAPGRPRPVRRRHRSHRRFLPDQQPDHARQDRRGNHQRFQAHGDPQDHRLRAPRPQDAAATSAPSPWTTRSAAPWASSARPG